jgi:transposase
MEPKTNRSPESVVREIKRKTHRRFNHEEKIQIILEGLKGRRASQPFCRQKGVAPGLYHKRSKSFLEAGKKRLKGNTMREASSDEVIELRKKTSSSTSWLPN